MADEGEERDKERGKMREREREREERERERGERERESKRLEAIIPTTKHIPHSVNKDSSCSPRTARETRVCPL